MILKLENNEQIQEIGVDKITIVYGSSTLVLRFNSEKSFSIGTTALEAIDASYISDSLERIIYLKMNSVTNYIVMS